MSIIDRIFKGKAATMSTADKIAKVEGQITASQAAQTERDTRIKSLQHERAGIELDAVAGDKSAADRIAKIDSEIARLESLSGDTARVLAMAGDELRTLKQAMADEQGQAARAAVQKQAKADLRRLPTMFARAKEIRQELASLQAELRGMGANGADLDSDDLDAEEATATAWVEWKAGIRNRDPVTDDAMRRSDEFQEARRRREQEDRGRRAAEDERLSSAGWSSESKAGDLGRFAWSQ